MLSIIHGPIPWRNVSPEFVYSMSLHLRCIYPQYKNMTVFKITFCKTLVTRYKINFLKLEHS